MKVLIVGCGRVGSGLAIDLAGAGHEIRVLDRDISSFRLLPSDLAATTSIGSGLDRDDLIAAGIESADGFAAVTAGDNTNIVSARIAREHFGVEQVVARIFDPRRATIYERLGIPTVASVAWATSRIAHRLDPSVELAEWEDPGGGLVLVERSLPDAWAGRNLDGLTTPTCRLTAVRRGGESVLAAPALVGQPGDTLYLATYRDALDGLDTLLATGNRGTQS
jgi:trk system potassium uptake protein TrkA